MRHQRFDRRLREQLQAEDETLEAEGVAVFADFVSLLIQSVSYWQYRDFALGNQRRNRIECSEFD